MMIVLVKIVALGLIHIFIFVSFLFNTFFIFLLHPGPKFAASRIFII